MSIFVCVNSSCRQGQFLYPCAINPNLLQLEIRLAGPLQQNAQSLAIFGIARIFCADSSSSRVHQEVSLVREFIMSVHRLLIRIAELEHCHSRAPRFIRVVVELEFYRHIRFSGG